MNKDCAEDVLEIAKLVRCMNRLMDEYNTDAPKIIKKAELLLIKDICDKLLEKNSV